MSDNARSSLLSRLLRRKSKFRSWEDATPQEITEARLTAIEESVQHLSSSAAYAFEQCVPFRAESRPQDVFLEEWGK